MLEKLFPAVRSGETQRFKFFLVLLAMLMAGQATSMVVCESLVLSRLGVQALPGSVLVASAMSIFAAWLFPKFIGRWRHEQLMLKLLAFVILVIAGTWPLVTAGFKASYVGIFGFHFVTFGLFTGHFHTLASDYFDSLAAKRLLPLLGVGGTLGEIAGGLGGSALTKLLSLEALLGAWIGFYVLAGVWIVRHRAKLKEWNPGETKSSQQSTEAKSQRSGLSVVRQSGLAQGLGISIIMMIGAMSMVSYVCSDVFATSFPDEKALGAFFGTFVAVTNVIELAFGARITPWLIAKLGVAQSNMIHAAGAVLTLGLLSVNYSLVPAMLAWANRKMIHDSLGGPVRNLVYNALPVPDRIPAREFLGGLVGSVARAIASLTLMILQTRMEAKNFVTIGLFLAGLYLAGTWLVRQRYLKTLLQGLSEGRLNLSGDPTLLPSKEGVESVWRALLKNPEDLKLGRITALLKRLGREDLLLEGLRHKSDSMRLRCAEALRESIPISALQDKDPEIRMLALEIHWKNEKLMEPLLEDSNDKIRMTAQAALGNRQALGTPEALTPEAVRHLHKDLLAWVIQLLDSQRPEIRAAALERLNGVTEISLQRVAVELNDVSEPVVLAALDCLSSFQDPLAGVFIARSLESESNSIRNRAAHLLGQRGKNILPHLEPYLRAEKEAVVESAFTAVAAADEILGRELLAQELRLMVREAWRSIFLRSEVAKLDGSNDEFLLWALQDRSESCQRLAYRILALLEGESTIGPVLNTLRFSESSSRASAMEVLSNLGDREAAGLLVLLTERSELNERLKLACQMSPSLARQPECYYRLCETSPGRFVRWGAAKSLQNSTSAMVERLLELRQVDLFAELRLEELENVAKFMMTECFGPGEMVMSKDQNCSKIYVPCQGKLNHPGDLFGVVSALDGGKPRRNVKAVNRSRLLSLEGHQLEKLVRRNPGLAFPLFGRMVGQIRTAELPS